VRKVQQECLYRLRAGEVGSKLYKFAAKEFERKGYRKKTTKAGEYGFNHNLGHGLGLDVHEEPRLGPGGGKLVAGNVVTVEPGLYYPKIGGVRIEDAVVVTKGGHRNLTGLPKELQIL
jgi:Xaa-Pro aminopeptidase